LWGRNPLLSPLFARKGMRTIAVPCSFAQCATLEKKEPAIKQVNERLLKSLDPAKLEGIVWQVGPPRGMRCGALWAAKSSSAGCGTPSTIIQDRAECISLAPVRMRPAYHCKHAEHHLVSRTLIRMGGGPLAAILIHVHISWESSIRKRSHANTSHLGHVSNA
jgi:hypothetical protein